MLPEPVTLSEHSPSCSTGRMSITLSHMHRVYTHVKMLKSWSFRIHAAIYWIHHLVSPFRENEVENKNLKQAITQAEINLQTNSDMLHRLSVFTVEAPQQVSYFEKKFTSNMEN